MEPKADYYIICKKIREERKAKKLRQADMAEQLDISGNAYGAFERGIKMISLRRLLDICLILQVEPGRLLNDWYYASISSKKHDLTPSKREIILDYVATCSEDEIGAIFSLVCYYMEAGAKK